jgi:predicted O-methyltransferase YrrM
MPGLEFPLPLPPIEAGNRLGRCPREGYARGWALQFTDLGEKIRREESFERAATLAKGRTVVNDAKLANLYLLLRYYLPRLETGHIIEFGAYRGGSAIFMASLAKEFLPGVKVFALDTYEGMPPTDKSIDLHGAGEFNNTSVDEVQAAARAAGLDNLILVKGLFEDTTAKVMVTAGRIALAHIDCDIYPACVTAWDGCKQFMVHGGYIVFDDATAASCLGATEMVEQIVIRRDGLSSEQIFPHFVFRVRPL